MLDYRKLSEKQKYDIIKLTRKVSLFMEKYDLTSIKFDDVSYIDIDDFFDKVINVKIENKSEKDSFSVRLY